MAEKELSVAIGQSWPVIGMLFVVGCGGGSSSTTIPEETTTPIVESPSTLSPPLNFGFPGQDGVAEFQTLSGQILSGPDAVSEGSFIDTTIVVDVDSETISFLLPESSSAPTIDLQFTSGDLVETVLDSRSYANLGNESTNFALLGQPIDTGLQYTSFGAWATSQTDSTSTILLGGSSFGQVTDASTLPTTGSASYRGAIAGFYDSPDTGIAEVGGNFILNASFAALQLDGLITEVRRQIDDEAASWGDFQITNGTIDGAAINAAITGNDLAGRLAGQFFGPVGEEVGFSFFLSDADALQKFAGAGAGAITQ